ncbi:MAG: class II SORL domain-containing protein [Desulfobacterales bacterium]|nr:class II SORL domain-containing protein [Desulfobacterales bacterium]
MKKLKIELVVAVFIFISCFSSAAFADKSSASLEAPDSVERGTEITIKVNVTHSANNFFHYTKWVYIMVNEEEIARWDYSNYKNKRPEANNFTKEIKYIVTDDIIIQAESSCNIHGSKKKAIKKVFIK